MPLARMICSVRRVVMCLGRPLDVGVGYFVSFYPLCAGVHRRVTEQPILLSSSSNTIMALPKPVQGHIGPSSLAQLPHWSPKRLRMPPRSPAPLKISPSRGESRIAPRRRLLYFFRGRSAVQSIHSEPAGGGRRSESASCPCHSCRSWPGRWDVGPLLPDHYRPHSSFYSRPVRPDSMVSVLPAACDLRSFRLLPYNWPGSGQ